MALVQLSLISRNRQPCYREYWECRANYDRDVQHATTMIKNLFAWRCAGAVKQGAIILLLFAIFDSPRLAWAQASSGPNSAPSAVPNPYDPVADPTAEVDAGHARFTVLTPQLIRMEWAADGRFEDHASLVFLNRNLPVPNFGLSKSNPHGVDVVTDSLRLHYDPRAGSDGRFTAGDLSITFTLSGKKVTWHPGMPDRGNL